MDDRTGAAESLLREMGIAGRVTAAGHDASIATIAVAPERWAELTGPAGRELAGRLRALGFRYVAIDLAESATPGPTRPGTHDT